MTLEERLKQLPETADELAADVRADERLYQAIRYEAARTPATRRRTGLRILVPAALVFAAVMAVLVLPRVSVTPSLRIESVTAGSPGEPQPVPSTRADVPAGSVSLGSGDDIPAFRSIWAGNSDSSFPMILFNGAYYRLLSSPKKLSDSQLAGSVSSVEQYTTEMYGNGLCSNAVLQGETVWQVRGMGQAVLAARIDGALRVFQLVTANGAGRMPGSLYEAIPSSGVKELSLSGVGRVRDGQTAQRLLSTLLNGAYAQGSGCQRSGQVLHIVYSNGVTLQMYVRDASLSAGGTWSCPDFFDQFRQAI